MPDFYVFQFLPIVLVEALALRFLKWGPVKRCLLDSLLMNSASFLGLMLNLAPHISTAGPFGLLLYCVYSTMIEGVVLTLMERGEPGKIWSAALIANLSGVFVLGVESAYFWMSNGYPPGLTPK